MKQKIKIVATIGPVSAKPNMLKKMYKAGMSIARLNGSHNTLDWHSKTIKLIKDIIPDCPILLDIPGKKIRTIKLIIEPEFKKNNILILTTSPGHYGEKKISITNQSLHIFLKKGDILYADDGTLKFTVIKVIKKDIYIKANVSGKLRSSKGINVPHVNISGNLITDRDKKMIAFAEKNKVDFIGLSFIESGDHLKKIRKLIKKNIPKLIAKVENQRGLDNLDSIVKNTDCIMIDRGDLSTETSIEMLAINQKKIISCAKNNAIPVIVATEMLDNMIKNPYPTKAEVLDIYNSVGDGATATMLSGETAVGNFPINAIQVMNNIAHINLKKEKIIKKNISNIEYRGMALAIKNLCDFLPITKVVAITVTGFAARIVSSHDLNCPILAVTNNKELAKSFNIFLGTKGIYFNTKFFKNNVEHIPKCINHLWKLREITDQDMILVVALGYPSSGRRMNFIQTHYVRDLKKIFCWK
ncbi:MAG: pyruvate kinase [Crocinitomicaceae bacterium TMED209]|nr:MAG: pyruvate kinase [Crocinitomicaceae bacterium TMED209]